MTALLLAVVALPLGIAGLVGLLLRSRPRAARWLAWSSVVGSLSALVPLRSAAGGALQWSVPWLESGSLTLSVGLRLDGLSWTVALVVAGIGSVVLLYSAAFSRAMPSAWAFSAWLAAFVGAMLALVLAGTLLTLFIAWELVGVASFALIGFHHKEQEAKRAATKAMLVTRVASLGLLAAMLLVLLELGTTDIARIHGAAEHGQLASPVLLAALMAIAALGKAAQLPLSTWLPAAMVAPPPVSALLHAATMVAAGVYLLMRLFPVFERAPAVVMALAVLAAVGALFAAWVATAESDLKRVLAWSTILHFAEMVMALAWLDPAGAVQHLAIHAIFKAGLFLAAGVFEQRGGSSELSKLPGVARAVPGTGAAFVVCALAQTAIFPFAGFFSLRTLMASSLRWGLGGALLVVALTALGGIYTGRLLGVVWSHGRVPRRDAQGSGWIMPGAAVALALATLVVGPALDGALDRLLPFEPAPAPPAVWVQLALWAAGMLGLAFGAHRAWRRGAVPSLGSWPLAGAHALDLVLARTAGLVAILGAALDRIERALAAGAARLAAATQRSAGAVDELERAGFEDAADVVGEALLAGGERVRGLEVGKIHLYAASLFGSALAIGLMLALVTWLAGGMGP